MDYTFKAKIWIFSGEAAWHFATLPEELGIEIKTIFSQISNGFGSIPVKVNIQNKIWKTSIFPDKKSNSYLLPIKSKIRKSINFDFEKTYEINLKILIDL